MENNEINKNDRSDQNEKTGLNSVKAADQSVLSLDELKNVSAGTDWSLVLQKLKKSKKD